MATATLNCELMRELVSVIDKKLEINDLEPSSTLYQLAISSRTAYHSVVNYAKMSMQVNTKDYDLSFAGYFNSPDRPILTSFYHKFVGTVNIWLCQYFSNVNTKKLEKLLRSMSALRTLRIKNAYVMSREALTVLANDSRINVLEIIDTAFTKFQKDQLIRFAYLDELHIKGNLSRINVKLFEEETFPILRKIVVKETFLSTFGVKRLMSFIKQQAATVETVKIYEKKPSGLPHAKHLSFIQDSIKALSQIAFTKRVEVVFEASRKKSEVQSWAGNGFEDAGDYYVQHHRSGQGHLWYYIKK